MAFTVWHFKGCTGGIMKRILLVLMSVFMLAFLVGCGNDASKPTESAKPSTSERMEFSMSTQSAQNTISKVPELSLASYIARNIKVGNNI